ncbi:MULTISPECIES: hypothetical protein [unclassified Bradyrhizobium]|uniref:hypothetical protein n=1 Tax=unclassified Bradyrhizobium TaxID=2631580 RepID=UPI002915E08D|nr:MULTISPECIES: hypothetical protein [unclassified Bradyrhizobium]
MQYSVWATAHLDSKSEQKLRDFFTKIVGIPSSLMKRELHVTVYHARRNMRNLSNTTEAVSFAIPGSELRMMAMAPGGENPRDDVDPSRCMIGLRIRRANGASAAIEGLRERFYCHETIDVLGTRRPSDHRRSAFGAHHFQPHISVLKPGAIADPNLSGLGKLLRDSIDEISFDHFSVKCRAR